jgi:hypothetical protein
VANDIVLEGFVVEGATTGIDTAASSPATSYATTSSSGIFGTAST